MYIWDCFSLGLRWEIHVVSLIMYTCVLQVCMVSKKSFVIFDVVGCVVVVVVVVSCITCLQKGHTAWITAGMIWCTHLNGKKKSILHFREIELNDLQQLLIWRMGPQLKNSTGALQILFYSWFYKVIWIQCVKCLINKYMTNAVSCLPETALWNAHGHPFCKKKHGIVHTSNVTAHQFVRQGCFFLSLFSCHFDDQLSQSFHRFVI